MIIFGWGGGTPVDRGAAVAITCPKCHNPGFWHWKTVKKTLRLYFVPVLPYSIKHFLVCPTCQAAIEIAPEQRPAVERMVQLTAANASGTLSDADYSRETDGFLRGTLGADRGIQPAPALSEPPPAPPALAAAGADVVWTHLGARYLFGYSLSPAYYGIWERGSPSEPVQRFPYSEFGKKEALTAFDSLEPSHVAYDTGGG